MKHLDREVLIFSGEGIQGTWELYQGPKTWAALEARLDQERCEGDRWAEAYIQVEGRTYAPLSPSGEFTVWREVPANAVRDNR
jgi:hypothetical protein